MSRFYGYVVLTLVTAYIVRSSTCVKHHSIECKRAEEELKCGKNALAIKNLWHRMEYLTLTELPQDDALFNNTFVISVNDKLKIIDKNLSDTPSWKMKFKYDKAVINYSHILLGFSEKVTFLSDNKNSQGYISQHVATAFYKPSLTDEKKYDFEVIKTDGNVTLKITFDMRDDRTLSVFSNEGYITVQNSLNLSCVQFIDRWDEDSCEVLYSNVSLVTCACRFRDVEIFNVAVKTIIGVLQHSEHTMSVYFIATSISLLFLILTLSLYLRLWKSLTSGNSRFKVQVNLTVSFLFRHLSLLVGLGIVIFDRSDRVFCNISAISNLYFLITSVLWILLEGVMIYRKVCKSDINITNRKVYIAAVLIWILPLFLVTGVTVNEISKDHLLHITESYRVMHERLMGNHTDTYLVSSLLSGERKYSFCVAMSPPVLIVESIVVALSLLINTVILIWVGILVWRIQAANNKNLPSHEQSIGKNARCQVITTFRAVAILTTVLGIPWLFSSLYILITDIEKTNSIVPTAVEYFFLFLQGPALFYFYCVKNTEFRNACKQVMTKNKLKA